MPLFYVHKELKESNKCLLYELHCFVSLSPMQLLRIFLEMYKWKCLNWDFYLQCYVEWEVNCSAQPTCLQTSNIQPQCHSCLKTCQRLSVHWQKIFIYALLLFVGRGSEPAVLTSWQSRSDIFSESAPPVEQSAQGNVKTTADLEDIQEEQENN